MVAAAITSDAPAMEAGAVASVALLDTQLRPAWIHTKAGRWRASDDTRNAGTFPPHIFLATDLDCTLTMDDSALAQCGADMRGDVDAATAAFNRRWTSMAEGRGRCVLCYSTGRSLELFESLISEQRARTEGAAPDGPLLLPDVLITSDGTSIHWRDEDGALQRDDAWDAILRDGWDVDRVRRTFREDPAVAKYGVENEKWLNRLEDFRVSVIVEGEEEARIAEDSVRRALEACKGTEANVFTCAHAHGPQFWLVATSAAGGKGRALDYARRRAGAEDSARVLVAGDSGNDACMFDRAARGGVRGVVVGNAKPELVEFAKQFDGHLFAEQHCAEAITFALDKWSF